MKPCLTEFATAKPSICPPPLIKPFAFIDTRVHLTNEADPHASALRVARCERLMSVTRRPHATTSARRARSHRARHYTANVPGVEPGLAGVRRSLEGIELAGRKRLLSEAAR